MIKSTYEELNTNILCYTFQIDQPPWNSTHYKFYIIYLLHLLSFETNIYTSMLYSLYVLYMGNEQE